jgi:excisionase family DNA binding protein
MAEELLTAAEAAKRLKVHRSTVYSWIDQGLLGCVRLRRPGRDCIRLRESDLQAFCEAHAQPPKDVA